MTYFAYQKSLHYNKWLQQHSQLESILLVTMCIYICSEHLPHTIFQKTKEMMQTKDSYNYYLSQNSKSGLSKTFGCCMRTKVAYFCNDHFNPKTQECGQDLLCVCVHHKCFYNFFLMNEGNEIPLLDTMNETDIDGQGGWGLPIKGTYHQIQVFCHTTRGIQ